MIIWLVDHFFRIGIPKAFEILETRYFAQQWFSPVQVDERNQAYKQTEDERDAEDGCGVEVQAVRLVSLSLGRRHKVITFLDVVARIHRLGARRFIYKAILLVRQSLALVGIFVLKVASLRTNFMRNVIIFVDLDKVC